MSEIWLPILKFNSYLISNIGRVKNNNTGRIIKSRIDKDEYVKINLRLNKKLYTPEIHRLVLLTFLPIDNVQDFQVHHINHIRYDNRLENLVWLSKFENLRNKIKSSESYNVFKELKRRYGDKLLAEKLKSFL